MKISYCIAIRDRLFHLKQTLPISVKENSGVDAEFVISDSGSIDGLEEWLSSSFPAELKSGAIKHFRTIAPKFWQFAREKNLSHSYASGQIVCNLDADNIATKAFSMWLLSTFSENENSVAYFLGDAAWGGGGGRVTLSAKSFKSLGGYDEYLNNGWGYDDMDLVNRAVAFGIRPVVGRSDLVSFLRHGDDVRTVYMENQNKNQTGKLAYFKSAQNIKDGKVIANQQ